VTHDPAGRPPPGAAGRERAVRDALYRLALRAAARALGVWWRLTGPRIEGVAVFVQVGGEFLLIRNSYRRSYSLPGGRVRRGEARDAAAARELGEETGIRAAPGELAFLAELRVRHSGVEDHVHFFALRCDAAPEVRIDRREVVWAEFRTPEDALALELWKPLEVFLRTGGGGPAPGGSVGSVGSVG
jgi:ADP-ribose pyrophosphatase YjhB (NUDIX family)